MKKRNWNQGWLLFSSGYPQYLEASEWVLKPRCSRSVEVRWSYRSSSFTRHCDGFFQEITFCEKVTKWSWPQVYTVSVPFRLIYLPRSWIRFLDSNRHCDLYLRIGDFVRLKYGSSFRSVCRPVNCRLPVTEARLARTSRSSWFEFKVLYYRIKAYQGC